MNQKNNNMVGCEKDTTQINQSAESRALERFTDLLIERLHTIQADWKQPWISENATKAPRNLSNRPYNGSNSLILSLVMGKNNYDMPHWVTFDRIAALNFVKNTDGTRSPTIDADGNKLPMVTVNKGEKSTPVFITTYSVVDKETKERIKWEDYKQLTDEEKAKYNVFPKMQVFNVFSVCQTNLKEARPELWKKLSMQVSLDQSNSTDKGVVQPALDAIIKQNGWVCPIKEVHGDNCYYSISKDEIVVAERCQFQDAESFVSTVYHECAHSLGSEGRLNRLKPGNSFTSQCYATEELVAELSAAVTCAHFGMTKPVKNDSLPYLKSWLDSMSQSPEYLKTVLNDVKKTTGIMIQRIDSVSQRLEQGLPIEAMDVFKKIENAELKAQKDTVAAKASAMLNIPDEVIMTKLDDFMQHYYWAARKDNGFRMQGFTEHEGRPALKVVKEGSTDASHYIITHEPTADHKDHFYMHLMDAGLEIFKSREMPHNHDDAYSFMRGASRELVDYLYEKKNANQESQEESVSFKRGR